MGTDAKSADLRLVGMESLCSQRAVSPMLHLEQRQRPWVALFTTGTRSITVTTTVHYRPATPERRMALDFNQLGSDSVYARDLSAALTRS